MSTPRFGMVISPQGDGGFLNEFGTMLEVRNVQMLADGRSVVATHGAYRFRIVERRMIDDYMVARVERCVVWFGLVVLRWVLDFGLTAVDRFIYLSQVRRHTARAGTRGRAHSRRKRRYPFGADAGHPVHPPLPASPGERAPALGRPTDDLSLDLYIDFNVNFNVHLRLRLGRKVPRRTGHRGACAKVPRLSGEAQVEPDGRPETK